MKICPTCQTTHDDFQNFCLKDGSALVVAASPTVPREPVEVIEEKTVVRSSSPNINVSDSAPRNYSTNPVVVSTAPVQPSLPPTVVVERKSRNTGKVVALTALATLLLAALAAGAYYLATQNRDQPIAQANTGNRNSARPRNANSATVSAAIAANANANTAAAINNANQNAANANVVAVPSPSAQPILSNAAAKAVRDDVTSTIDDWKASTENGDINSHIGFYAPTVDYYKSKGASVSRVRADRQKAFATYPDIEIDISNLRVTPDATGEKATAVFDKAWRFENDGTTSEGKVQQQLTLEKLGDRWIITGERDLKSYGSSKY